LHGSVVWHQPVLRVNCHRLGRSPASGPSRTTVSGRCWY